MKDDKRIDSFTEAAKAQSPEAETLRGMNTHVAGKCQNRFRETVILTKLELNSDKMRKTTVLESINKLPDEFSIDEIIERLIVIEKIEKGLQDVRDGKINTEEQANAKLSKWLN